MARFGQGLIQALTNPSYQQGLFTAAQQLGSAPRRGREQEAQSTAMTMVNEALASNDPTKILQAAKVISPIDPALALELSKSVGSLNQQAAQASMARSNAVSAAEAAGLSEDVINGFRDSPEILSGLAKDVAGKSAANNLDKIEENRQIRVQTQRAQQLGAPKEIVDDVASGLYVNQNSKLLDALQGKDASQDNYINAEGKFVTLPSRGSKVLVNNRWVTPDQAGLVAAPTTTAETTLTEFGSTNKLVGPAALSAGITKNFINSLDTAGDLSGLLARAATENTIGLYSDYTKDLIAFRTNVSEVFTRFATGAAVKDDELPRYENMFTLTSSDLLAPVASAQKVVRTAALISADAKLMSGEITPAQARQFLEKAGSISFSPEEQKQLKSNKPGSFKKVIKKYTDAYFGEIQPVVSDADQILKELGI